MKKKIMNALTNNVEQIAQWITHSAYIWEDYGLFSSRSLKANNYPK